MPNLHIAPLKRNYADISRLVNRAWSREHKNYIDYSADYLKYLIEDPQVIPELSVAVYENEKLVSFLLSKEKLVYWQGRKWKTLFNTLAATEPDYAHCFPYLKLKQHCVSWASENGFSLGVGYVVSGISNNYIETVFAERGGYHCSTASSFASLAKDLQVDTGKKYRRLNNVDFQDIKVDNLSICNDLIERSVKICGLYEVIDNEALAYRLNSNQFVYSQLIESNNNYGLINYQLVTMHTITGNKRVAIVGGLFLDNFSIEIKHYVLNYLCDKLRDDGIDRIIIPQTGYFKHESIRDLGFHISPFKGSQTNLYLTSFKESVKHSNTETSFYMEVA